MGLNMNYRFFAEGLRQITISQNTIVIINIHRFLSIELQKMLYRSIKK